METFQKLLLMVIMSIVLAVAITVFIYDIVG